MSMIPPARYQPQLETFFRLLTAKEISNKPLNSIDILNRILKTAKVLNKEQDKASILGQLRKFTEQIRTQAKEKQRTREAVKDGR